MGKGSPPLGCPLLEIDMFEFPDYSSHSSLKLQRLLAKAKKRAGKLEVRTRKIGFKLEEVNDQLSDEYERIGWLMDSLYHKSTK